MSAITTKDGTQIYYKDWGKGQPIVFSHGWPLTADDWDGQMLFFGQHGYRVIAHDRRGHGRSDQTWDGNEMDTYADDLAVLFEKLDLKDATMVGHSTGGGEVARYFGRRHGAKRVAKAVLISSVPPLMLKTEKNPGGLPISAFDSLRAALAANRPQFYKDINVVRCDEVVADMKALGGDVVLVDGPDLATRVAAETRNAPITLALDGVSDTSPMNLMNCLSEGGVLVSYGGTSRKPMVVHPGSFIFKKQTIRGFWLLYWYRSAKPDEITAMFDHLAPLVAAGTIAAPLAATYRFDQVSEAITKAAQSGGKVLFTSKA